MENEDLLWFNFGLQSKFKKWFDQLTYLFVVLVKGQCLQQQLLSFIHTLFEQLQVCLQLSDSDLCVLHIVKVTMHKLFCLSCKSISSVFFFLTSEPKEPSKKLKCQDQQQSTLIVHSLSINILRIHNRKRHKLRSCSRKQSSTPLSWKVLNFFAKNSYTNLVTLLDHTLYFLKIISQSSRPFSTKMSHNNFTAKEMGRQRKRCRENKLRKVDKSQHGSVTQNLYFNL